MPFAFASRCLQGQLLWLICQAKNKRVEREPGSDPEFYLVGGCGSLKGESLQGSREFAESEEVVTSHVILLLQISLASTLYEKMSQLFSSYLSPLYSTFPTVRRS